MGQHEEYLRRHAEASRPPVNPVKSHPSENHGQIFPKTEHQPRCRPNRRMTVGATELHRGRAGGTLCRSCCRRQRWHYRPFALRVRCMRRFKPCPNWRLKRLQMLRPIPWGRSKVRWPPLRTGGLPRGLPGVRTGPFPGGRLRTPRECFVILRRCTWSIAPMTERSAG